MGNSPRSSSDGALRVAARAVLRFALRAPAEINPSWIPFIERQLERIRSDVEALVWAVGCLWSARVERLIGRLHPTLNGTLFLAGLYLGVNFLLPHLSPYGVAPAPPGEGSATPRALARAVIFICCIAVVGLTAQGKPRRRIFAACTFPLLGIWALGAASIGMDWSSSIALPPACLAIERVLRGAAFGLFVAAALSLPASLLYRRTAVPVAILALIPVVAKAAWAAEPGCLTRRTCSALFWNLWPFLCAFVLLCSFTRVCYRWQVRPLGRARSPPPC